MAMMQALRQFSHSLLSGDAEILRNTHADFAAGNGFHGRDLGILTALESDIEVGFYRETIRQFCLLALSAEGVIRVTINKTGYFKMQPPGQKIIPR